MISQVAEGTYCEISKNKQAVGFVGMNLHYEAEPAIQKRKERGVFSWFWKLEKPAWL